MSVGLRIVIAPDKFKGSLAAKAVAAAIESGFRRVFPDAVYERIPVADGGDGTAQTLVDCLGGRIIEATVTGPDGKSRRAAYALLSDGRTAIVELAQASGLALLEPGSNEPLAATTYGTGELIAAAIDAGAVRVIVAIGGSATNDAGSGALSALGAKFLDAEGRRLPPGGASLSRLNAIDTSALERRLRNVSVELASDVKNPLCGPSGAAAVYGPQKGASPEQTALLDAALWHFADVVLAHSGADIRNVPGAGAAGGTGGGFLALARATLRPGAQLVLELIEFDRRLQGADLVVTGEGRLDRQSFAGKAPLAVAAAAKRRGIPAVAIAGSVDCPAAALRDAGIWSAFPIAPGPISLLEALLRAEELTANAAERLAGAIHIALRG
ncbi:MAG: glycerate kinase [Candidatus Eremiobacteraeota bacterium]|nr:glycerate kinase [Candidatus Eremiobacteraeota bacterium]